MITSILAYLRRVSRSNNGILGFYSAPCDRLRACCPDVNFEEGETRYI